MQYLAIGARQHDRRFRSADVHAENHLLAHRLFPSLSLVVGQG
jgi:hypothetical protein